MQIDGADVPQSVIAIWMAAIDQLSAHKVRLLAAARPSVTQGFRPGSIDVNVGRERLKLVLTKSAELPVDIREQLRGTGLATSLLIVFSVEALERIAVPLAGFFGFEATASSFLLDDRLAVRALGRSLLAPNAGTVPPSTQYEAAAQLIVEIGPFLKHIREILYYHDVPVVGSGVVTPKSNASGSELVQVRAPRPKREVELVSLLRTKRLEVNRLTRENGSLNSRLNLVAAERAAKSAKLDEILGQLKATQAELRELKVHFETRVDEAVRSRLDEKLLPWLKSSEALAQTANFLGVHDPLNRLKSPESETPVGHEVIQTAQRLLSRQAELDRRFGLRSAMRAERDRCKDLLVRLHEAQVDSIKPLAELTESIRSLELRIRQIDEVFGSDVWDDRKSPVLLRLEATFAKAGSLDDLSILRKRLIACEPLGLLSEEELSSAYELLGTASSKAYARVGVGSDWAVGRKDLSGLPLYAMKAALSCGKACTLVVDGHNVLWMVPALFRVHYEQGQPGAQARQALQSALLALAARHPTLTTHLWFDSKVMEDRTLAENLRVHFSGGEGANRADRQMLAFLAHMSASATDEIRTIATADTDVAASAQAAGALVMTPQELAILLS